MIKKIITFCLWGNEPKYTTGLIENIKLAKIYYPTWECWCYIHILSVNNNIIEKIKQFDNIKIIIKKDTIIRPKRFMLWRFEATNDPDVKYLISRDTDTRIQLREVLAVNEWLNSDKTLHIMRDHPQHYPKILGGMYGLKCDKMKNIDLIKNIENFFILNGENADDQKFIENELYIKFNNDRIIHDEIKRYEGTECLQYPIPFEQNGHFVGCYIYEDGSTDYQTSTVLLNWLKYNLPNRINTDNITLEHKYLSISKIIKNVYIIHYTKLTDRKDNMKKQIKNLYLDIFFNINWIEQFDRENISSEMIQKNYIYNPNILKRQMPIAEIANGIAHKYILETIKEKNETALILEDDTVFKEGLINNLYYILKNISDDWEIICLGGPTYDENFPDKTLSGSTRTHFCSNEIILHKPNTPAPHTMSCILINKKGVDKLLDSKYMNPLSCPIDHAVWLSGIDKNVIMYWSQPWISFEGSKSDNFEPSLNKNF